jgi:hypothetical protein
MADIEIFNETLDFSFKYGWTSLIIMNILCLQCLIVFLKKNMPSNCTFDIRIVCKMFLLRVCFWGCVVDLHIPKITIVAGIFVIK